MQNKINTLLLSLVLLLSISSCKEKDSSSNTTYTLQKENGIFVEVFDPTNTNENRYTINNKTFTSESSFIYSYHYTAKDKKRYFFQEDFSENKHPQYSWKFVLEDSITSETITNIKISVSKGLQPMISQDPQYNQTVVFYEYLTREKQVPFNAASGVIENEKNIWAHPPRDKFFSILELNPFPFISAPYKIGNSWEWQLTIGSFWGDLRWKKWKGSIVVSFP